MLSELELEENRHLNAQLALEEEMILKDLTDEETRAKELALTELHEKNKTKITKKGAKDRVNTNKWAAMQIAGATASLLMSLASSQSARNKKEFEDQKKLSIASTVISTYQAAMNAFKSASNPVVGAVLAAIVVAIGLANVAKIKGTKYGGGGSVSPPSSGGLSGAGGGGGGGGTTTAATIPSNENIPTTQTQQQEQPIQIQIALDGQALLDYTGKATSDGRLIIDANAVR